MAHYYHFMKYTYFGPFKVLYRPDGQHDGKLYSTHKHSIEVPIPRDGEYVVEVRAHSDGGDGVVSQVRISGKLVMSVKYS